MGNGLPFPFEMVFLVLVLPLAFAWLISVASVATFAMRKGVNKLFARLRLRDPAPPGR